jgi:ABC-type transport system substrate-binding protein
VREDLSILESKKKYGDYLCKPLLFLALQIWMMGSLPTPEIWAGRIAKIGMLEEPKTLNIWLAADGWSRKVLRLMYNPLYIRDPESLEPIPWLAEEEPFYDADSLSYTIKLRPVKWSDGSPLTVEDVIFTANTITEFKIPRYFSNWEFISKVKAIDKRKVRIFLDRPKAIFLTRTIFTPIVQKKQWAKIVPKMRRAKNPLSELLKSTVERPVGTGPFILKKWEKRSHLYLAKNAHFFGRGKTLGGRLLGPYVDGMILKTYGTTDAAILAIRKGTIDTFWWGLQPGYLEDLREDRHIEIIPSEKSSLTYLGFNLRKNPFNEGHFRQAVATLIDKRFIVKRILHGYGDEMNSIVPSVNRSWYCPDLRGNSEGFSRKERVRAAYEILKRAGYTWEAPPIDPSGNPVKGEGIVLPNAEPMKSFTILTPTADYDPHRAVTGIMIQAWLNQLGIPATAKPMSFGALFHRVSALHRFDLFILGTGELSIDPDYLRNFFHSANDKAGGWNMSGYKNPHFDTIAEASSNTLDFEQRRQLIWEMQRMLVRDIPYLPLYTAKHIEAVRTDRFQGWVRMMGGIGNLWSFCLIRSKSTDSSVTPLE